MSDGKAKSRTANSRSSNLLLCRAPVCGSTGHPSPIRPVAHHRCVFPALSVGHLCVRRRCDARLVINLGVTLLFVRAAMAGGLRHASKRTLAGCSNAVNMEPSTNAPPRRGLVHSFNPFFDHRVPMRTSLSRTVASSAGMLGYERVGHYGVPAHWYQRLMPERSADKSMAEPWGVSCR
jgi:hypothetical protein